MPVAGTEPYLDHGHAGLRAGYGENLYWGGSFGSVMASCALAVEAWYDERYTPGYGWNDPGWSIGTGHFTQTVWKESTGPGCGRAAGKGDVYGSRHMSCACTCRRAM